MGKKCGVCGDTVASDAIECPKCGRGIFESEKLYSNSVDTARSASSIDESYTGKKRQSPSFWKNLFDRKEAPKDRLGRFIRLIEDHFTRLIAALSKFMAMESNFLSFFWREFLRRYELCIYYFLGILIAVGIFFGGLMGTAGCPIITKIRFFVILSEAKNLIISICCRFKILRLMPQNDILGQPDGSL